MRKRVTHLFLSVLAVGAAVLLAQNAQSQLIVYNDGTASTYNGNFNFNNATAGNEIVLATPGNTYISEFQLQFDLINSGSNPFAGAPTGNEEVDLTFYQNNGAKVAGYNSPGTVLFDSGFYSFGAIGLTSFTEGTNLIYNPDVIVPQDFTWVVTFADVPVGETAGLALRSPATVGANYQDAWYNNGSGWQLQVAGPGNPPLEFGAEAETLVPDSSCLWFSVLAVGAGFWGMNRSIRRQPSL